MDDNKIMNGAAEMAVLLMKAAIAVVHSRGLSDTLKSAAGAERLADMLKQVAPEVTKTVMDEVKQSEGAPSQLREMLLRATVAAIGTRVGKAFCDSLN